MLYRQHAFARRPSAGLCERLLQRPILSHRRLPRHRRAETGSRVRRGVPADAIEERLRRDKDHRIKAVLVVQTETSTGVTSSLAAVRKAMDAAAHPALLLADVVSSLGCTDLRFDEWKLDVALTAAQKAHAAARHGPPRRK